MLDMCGMSVRQCLGQGQDRASEELWHTGSRTSQLSHLSLLREHLEISGHSSATMWDRERVGRGLILTASSRWSQDDAKAPARLRAATPQCKFLVPSGLESWQKKSTFLGAPWFWGPILCLIIVFPHFPWPGSWRIGELTMEVFVPSPPCLFILHLSFQGFGEVWRSNMTLVETCKRGHESLDPWLCPKTIKIPCGWNAEERGCRSAPFLWNKPAVSPTCLVDFVLS